MRWFEGVGNSARVFWRFDVLEHRDVLRGRRNLMTACDWAIASFISVWCVIVVMLMVHLCVEGRLWRHILYVI